MTIESFIRRNKSAIDIYIHNAINKNIENGYNRIYRDINSNRMNNRERELWISNDEYLYNWAQRKGVSI